MLDPKGRCIMISGANRGIGFALANELLVRGYSVSLGARDAGALKVKFASADPQRVSFHAYEAQDKGLSKAWVDETVARWGRIDGLINVAGILRFVRIEEDDEETLDLMWEINVKAPLRMIRLALPYLKASGSGRVINVSSLSGKRVRNGNVGYGMSKFAVMAVTQTIRRLGWEHGIRATSVCPGWVNTELAASAAPSVKPEDMTQPEDLAKVIATLIELPNNASMAELLINSNLEDML